MRICNLGQTAPVASPQVPCRTASTPQVADEATPERPRSALRLHGRQEGLLPTYLAALPSDHGSDAPVSAFEAVGTSRSFRVSPLGPRQRYGSRMMALATGIPVRTATRLEPRSSRQRGATARRYRGPRPWMGPAAVTADWFPRRSTSSCRVCCSRVASEVTASRASVGSAQRAAT
jgi:hypothetical protein